MRISDWSSDVCSSDLPDDVDGRVLAGFPDICPVRLDLGLRQIGFEPGPQILHVRRDEGDRIPDDETRVTRSEERRVGKESVSTCRSRRSQYHKKKNTTKYMYSKH